MLKSFQPTSGILARYARLVREVILPYQRAILNDEIEGVAPSHAMDNFKNAAKLNQTGKKSAEFYGQVFQDSDVAKWLEAAAYCQNLHHDAALEAYIDEVCDLIAAAQEEDGYLDTYFTLKRPTEKFKNLLEGHELYCAGHMMEAAVALYELTGKTKLLTVMKKNADLLYRRFVEEGQAGYPGHPEIELALMRLWRATDEPKYKELAEHFINLRGVDPDFYVKEKQKLDWQVWGNDPTNREYQQSHLPVREQRDAVGHAVRATYLYTAMADLAAVQKDRELEKACLALFDSIERRRMYITGGIGSSVRGEAFTADYDLPNDTAYCETCASIALIFFASKLLRLRRDGRFSDVMERALYNTVLGGIELDGKRFFYVNPLEAIPDVSGKIYTHRHALPRRPGWYNCACCPPNAARLLTSISEYAWDRDEAGVLYSNLFTEGELTLPDLHLSVTTDYPFGDTVTYKVIRGGGRLAIRIPAFSKDNFTVSAKGELREGYYYLDISEGDVITLRLDLRPRLVYANPRVAADSGKAAVMAGPLVFCAEGVDNDGDVFSLTLDEGAPLVLNKVNPADLGFPAAAEELGQVFSVTAEGFRTLWEDSDALYFSEKIRRERTSVRLIPYFMWSNRGLNQMRVWLPVSTDSFKRER